MRNWFIAFMCLLAVTAQSAVQVQYKTKESIRSNEKVVISVTGLEELTTDVQETAERAVEEKFEEANSNLVVKVDTIQTNLTATVSNLETRVNQSVDTKVAAAKTEMSSGLNSTSTEILRRVSEASAAANTRISETKVELEGKIDDAKADLEDQIASVEIPDLSIKTNSIAVGAGAVVTNGAKAIAINPNPSYPSVVSGNYGIAMGIDNFVGYGGPGTASKYSVAIGTSNRAPMQHAYAFGSQLNPLSELSLNMGYASSVTSRLATVVGMGNRTIASYSFKTAEEMTNFLSNASNVSKLYVDMGFYIGNYIGVGCDYGITRLLSYPDPLTGMYCELEFNPPDYKAGGHFWTYGKSHGDGTYTIVALGNGITSPGLTGVFINDDNLADLTGIHMGEMGVFTNYNKGVMTVTRQKNYSINIGSNTKNTGSSGDHCQSVSIGRDAQTTAPASVALGPNTEAHGDLSTAVGFRAGAIGKHGIAIGSGKSNQDYYTDDTRTEHNTNEYLCAAIGDDSIAMGYQARAVGKNSVQIGTGVCNEPNTLKFRDVTIVKNGKLAVDMEVDVMPAVAQAVTEALAEDRSPKIVDEIVDGEVLTVNPNTLTTFLPKEQVIDEVEVACTGMRNFDMFFPNEQLVADSLPILLQPQFDTTETKTINGTGRVIYKLPCRLKVSQPYSKLVIFEPTYYNDGADWKPVITNCPVTVTKSGSKCTFSSTGMTGTNLQACVSCTLTYPISSSANHTVELAKLNAEYGVVVGSTHKRGVTINHTTEDDKPVYFDGTGKSWYEIRYKTLAGEAEVIRRVFE